MLKQLPENIQKHWEELNYREPTPIQTKAYEVLGTGQSLVGISPTGSGKTVAYLLPLLERIEPKAGIQLVILVPSQELGMQVAEVARDWSKQLGLKAQAFIGGASIKRQLERLKEKPEIIVGTPGRLLELAELKKLKLHQVKALVLDECDHLLQSEHMSTLRQLTSKMPTQKQMGFFSATKSQAMSELAKWFNVEPVLIDISVEEDTSAGAVSHGFIETPTRKRVESLKKLSQIEDFRGLVFVNQVANLAAVAEKLAFEGVKVAVLHSDKNKEARKLALQQLKDKKVQLLLTTDVAARGLDIADLPYVIQYDLALSKEIYQHRAGRTGRMGATGCVLSLANEREVRELKKIWVQLSLKGQRFYLYGGEIVTERPKVEESPSLATDRQPKKVTTKAKTKSPKAEIPVKKKKKGKKKDKNKGKPKK